MPTSSEMANASSELTMEYAKQFLVDFIMSEGDKTINQNDLTVVWFSKAGGNWKAILNEVLLDMVQYQVSFDLDHKIIIIFVFEKINDVEWNHVRDVASYLE